MNRMPPDSAQIEKILNNDPKDRNYSLDAGARLVVKRGDQIALLEGAPFPRAGEMNFRPMT